MNVKFNLYKCKAECEAKNYNRVKIYIKKRMMKIFEKKFRKTVYRGEKLLF